MREQSFHQPDVFLGDAVQRNDVVGVEHELGLVPDFDQLVLKLADEGNDFERDGFEGLQLPDAGLRPLAHPGEHVLVQPQVELLLQERLGVLVDEVVHLALFLEDAEGTFQRVLVDGHALLAQGAQNVVHAGLASPLGIGGLEHQRVFALLLEGIDDVALFVGLLVLQRGGVEVESCAVQFHVEAAEQAVGLHVVEHVGLPEQHHVLVVGVHLLVHVLVQRGVAEVDRAALAEIAVEEVVQLLEKLIAEGGERL